MLAASHIPLDEDLPHLATVTNEDSMAALFAAHLAPGWSLRRCRVRDARYYPAYTCLLAYHLKCADADGEPSSVTLYARTFGREAVPEVFRARPPLATPVGRLPSYVPQLALALWIFPDDPGMLGLADVWRRGGAFFDAAAALAPAPWTGRRPPLEVALVSYVPSKRCILRYDRLDDGEPFYGKVYAAEDARQLHAQMQALWQHAQARAPELVLARPLGCDVRSNAVWQSSPGGESLLDVLGSADMPAVMRRIAAALAAVHRAELRPARRWLLADEAHKLERARAALGRFHPTLRRDVDAVLRALIAATPAESEHPAPVHGDFHCNQVLVRDDRVALIDFDLFAMGDPLHDVGRFLSRFQAYAAGKLREADLAAATASFLSTYEILVPWRVDRRRLGWIMAALLVNRQALKSVKKLSAGGPEPVAMLLERARLLSRGLP